MNTEQKIDLSTIQTLSVGVATYGPYHDGRQVFDAVHTDGKRYWYQSAYCQGNPPKLDNELDEETLLNLCHHQGWGTVAIRLGVDSRAHYACAAMLRQKHPDDPATIAWAQEAFGGKRDGERIVFADGSAIQLATNGSHRVDISPMRPDCARDGQPDK